MSQWVQHISGQGEKWKVTHENEIGFIVSHKGIQYACTLPKSEYRLCEPPEKWVDCTETCTFKHGVLLDHPEEGRHGWTVFTCETTVLQGQYRMRKVHFKGVQLGEAKPGWAFIVEKKETP